MNSAPRTGRYRLDERLTNSTKSGQSPSYRYVWSSRLISVILHRRSPIPLYRQVQQVLHERIEQGVLRPGDRLPAESELARELSVNRLTVRQAIAEMTRTGQLVARQGIGTFVTEPTRQITVTMRPTDMRLLAEQFERTTAATGRNTREVLLATDISDYAEARAELALGRRRMRQVDTLFLVEDQPWMVSSHWFADTRFPNLVDAISAGDTFFHAVTVRYGTEMHYAWRSFAAAAASHADAELLDLAAGGPMLVRDGLNIDADGVPTVFVHRRLRNDTRFVLRYDDADATIQ